MEDDAAGEYTLTRMLERAGFATQTAASGGEALRCVRAAPPDAILLDVRLPDLLGWELSRRLKSDPETASIPIIQMSASFPSREDRVAGLLGGSDGYLISPVEPDELVATLRTVLRQRESAREKALLLDSERAARAALEGANAQLRMQVQVLDNVRDSIIVTDLDGRIIYWNEGAARIFGYSAEQMLGDTPARLYPEEGGGLLGKDLDVIRAGGEYRGTWKGRRADGAEVWVDVNTRCMVSGSGEVCGFIGVGRDVTELHRLRAEAVRNAEAAQQLMGIVSHDLRNPLSAILVAAGLALRQQGMEPDLRRRLELIRGAAERSSRMVTDLLDFTAARLGGGVRLGRRWTDVHALADQVAAEVGAAWPGRRLEVVHLGDGAAEVDADRIAQVLTNLLSNALQHGAADVPVTLHSEGRADEVVLRVHNAGLPIPEALLEQLFEPYRQGGEAHEPGASRHGLGLGLFIVRHLVEAHGGTVAVRTSEDAGTDFSVRLPRRAPAP